jgi:beta-lactamase regulating signal transducer with metallopeptidase domain
MNAWLGALAAIFSAALIPLIQATVVLLAAIVIHQTIRRSPAARYEVVLWALVAVGLCPAMLLAVILSGVPAVVSLRHAMPFDVSSIRSEWTAPIHTGIAHSSAAHFPFAGILVLLWAAGALVGGVRLARGLHFMRRLRRAARPMSRVRIEQLRARVVAVLGRQVPAIVSSEQVGVPAALGCLRPVVLLPSSLLASLDDQQLFQVLVHECAHALRRDPLVGFYQRILASVLWFHPLVHIANHLLDCEREEVCDNYVLRAVAAAEYSLTLLLVAQSLSPPPSGWFAPTLVRSARHLEYRVAGLLNPRRCLMTRLRSARIVFIAIGFIGSAMVLSGFAAAPAPQQDSSNELSHVVPFELGTTYLQGGDSITIDAVRGTADTLSVGNMYQVQGSYKLASQEKALLAVFVTTNGSHSSASTPILRIQKMTVGKGEGHFTLLFYTWEDGSPHVSFYPVPSGDSFAGVYFGTGNSTFRSPRRNVTDRVNAP